MFFDAAVTARRHLAGLYVRHRSYQRPHTLDVQLPVLPVEEVGLYLLLERIYHGTAAAKDFARVALLQPGLVDNHTLNLSEDGKDRLQLLRAKLAASNDDLASAAVWRET